MSFAYVLLVGEGPNQRILGVFCDDGDAHDGYQVWSDLTKRHDVHHVLQIPYGVVSDQAWPQYKVMKNRDEMVEQSA